MSASRRLLGAMVVAGLVAGSAVGSQGAPAPAAGPPAATSAPGQVTLEYRPALPDEDITRFFEKIQKLGPKEYRVELELVARVGNDQAEHAVILIHSDKQQNAERFHRELAGQEAGWKYERALERSRITLDFPGGTVEEYIRAVGAKPKLPAPTFVSKDIAELRVRPVQLRELEFRKALQLLGKLAPTNEVGQAVPLETSWIGDMTSGAEDLGNSLELYQRALLIVGPVDRKQSGAVITRRAAFALGEESISKPALATLFDAIGVATNMDGKSKTFKAQYHEPSGLLIVRGTRDELGVVAQIVKAKFPKARTELPSFDPDPQDPIR